MSFRLAAIFVLTTLQLIGCSLGAAGKTGRFEKYNPDNDFLREKTSFSAEEEGTIGRAVAAQILGKYKVLNDKELNDYVSKVGATLAAASSRPNTFNGFTFRVLDTDEVNAISAPGGIIFISRGFLKLLADEDALAAVLAHEISHVNKLHGLLAIQKSNTGSYTEINGKLVSAIDCGGLAGQTLAAFDGAINDIVDKLLTSGYSKEQEYAADDGALELLKAAGYDPKAIFAALEILKAQGHKKAGWFTTHPSADDRIKVIGKISDSKQASLGKIIRTDRFKKTNN